MKPWHMSEMTMYENNYEIKIAMKYGKYTGYANKWFRTSFQIEHYLSAIEQSILDCQAGIAIS